MPRSKQVSEQMRAESKAALISSARHLFAGNGYFQCMVSDIARAADMSQGNVYWYFSSKEDLPRRYWLNRFESLGVLLEEAAALPMTSLEKLDYLLGRYMTFSLEHSDFGASSSPSWLFPIYQIGMSRVASAGSAVSVKLVIL